MREYIKAKSETQQLWLKKKIEAQRDYEYYLLIVGLLKSVLKGFKVIDLPQNALQISVSSRATWSKVHLNIFDTEHSNFYFDRWWEFSQFTYR